MWHSMNESRKNWNRSRDATSKRRNRDLKRRQIISKKGGIKIQLINPIKSCNDDFIHENKPLYLTYFSENQGGQIRSLDIWHINGLI